MRDASNAGQREAPHRFDIRFLEASLDASLRRLGTDRIDFYQMHNPRMAHLLDDDVWSFVERAQRAGKVRAVGVALGPAIGWVEEGLYALESLPVDGVQMIYTALELDPGRALIEAAERTGKSLVVRVPQSTGMREGRYTSTTTSRSTRRIRTAWTTRSSWSPSRGTTPVRSWRWCVSWATRLRPPIRCLTRRCSPAGGSRWGRCRPPSGWRRSRVLLREGERDIDAQAAGGGA